MSNPEGYVEMKTAKGLVRVPQAIIDQYGQSVPCVPPPVSLGPIGSNPPEVQTTAEFFPPEVEDLVEEAPVESLCLAPVEVEPELEDQQAVGKLERQQNLCKQVTEWLQTKDVDKFWRKFVAGSCNKNLSINTWPPGMLSKFNERFHQLLRDPVFVSTICKRILEFSNGHLVAPHVAAGFIVTTAGFLSFALLET